MKITPYISYDKTPTVLCLGGFDSIHKGHRKVIKKACEIKIKKHLNLAVMTFDDKSDAIDKFKSVVFTFDERVKILESLNVDEIISVEFTPEFANKEPIDFLNEIVDNRLIAAFVCGKDYTFGRFKKGNIALLKEFCNQKNIELIVPDFERSDPENKISTAVIKEALKNGDIEKANDYLGTEYFITGKVIHGREVGRTIGFPTANVEISLQKAPLKEGVYATTVLVKDKTYHAITNYGNAPTFGVERVLLESYLVGFKGDIYNENIKVNFKKFIRGVVKFECPEQLIKQLNEDLKVIR